MCQLSNPREDVLHKVTTMNLCACRYESKNPNFDGYPSVVKIGGDIFPTS